MLTLWGRDTSLNVQKPLWALLEVGVPFKRVDAGGAFGGIDTPDYLSLNPNGRVPTLVDGETVVWESNAVTRYVCAKWGQGTLWSDDPGVRARADMWMDWQQTVLGPTFLPIFVELIRVPSAKRNMDMVARQTKATGEVLGLLDRWLDGRDYIGGKALDMGDIPVGATLYRYFELPIERPKLPNVEAYYARLQERKAYRDGAMISFEPLRVKE